MKQDKLIEFLDRKVSVYEQPGFIALDPVSIPHMFRKKQDIEIAGFFAAVFAWGNRTTIINKSRDLLNRMDNAPYDFIRNSNAAGLRALLGFKHRTFNDTDLLYFVEFLKYHYGLHRSLETAFTRWGENVGQMLSGFYHYFFSLPHVPERTRKHIASPERNASCKRLNMFLRWMVRRNSAVDFGIWKNIQPAQLIIPIDLHVARVARRFGLLSRNQVDWQAAEELTQYLRTLDPNDPVKYDFALFGLGVAEKYQ
ncbi:MAG TPA: TIGR02757 family protein [Chitinophagaceae bacterium]